MVQFSHLYMATRKTIALTRWTFVGKEMSLLFNMLSRLVIAFLPRSNCLNFMAAVTICSDFGAPPNKVCHCFTIYLLWNDEKRQRNQRSNCQHLLDHWRSKIVPEKHLFLLYWLCQSLIVWITIHCGKFWKRWEYQTTWPASWETYMQVRKQQFHFSLSCTGGGHGNPLQCSCLENPRDRGAW